MESYDHKKIEKKWQDKWEKEKIYNTPQNIKGKENFYTLTEFTYPSGDLHVGHWYAFAVPDIFARFKRMQGYNVLYPTGFDSFGLPAENAAIKRGLDPRKWTYENMDRMRDQIRSMGASFDWSREIVTSDPEYYKWTQWIFTKMLDKGLAYKKKSIVNWDPVDKTVLANEQVLSDGTAERSGAVVEKREIDEWSLKITEYAEELLSGLDDLDWPEQIKEQQRNWIGKSEGAELEFKVGETDEKIKVFTTRPDTLMGTTYVVLAPEHQLVQKLLEKVSNKKDIKNYIEEAVKKSELERQTDRKEKTGIELQGMKAIHPISGEELPIFIADYVLASYGTGAVMAVPAHDERDFEFATKFNLPIQEVVIPSVTDTKNPPQEGKKDTRRNIILAVVYDPKEEKYLCLKWKKQPWTTFITGGIDDEEDAMKAAEREIEEETGYKNVRFVRSLGNTESKFFAAHKGVNRQVHNQSFLFELVDTEQNEISEEEKEQYDISWLSSDEIEKTHIQHAEFDIIWQRIQDEKTTAYTGHGVLVNSGEFDGLDSQEAKKVITEKAGGKLTTTFRLRDWSVGRQRYWGTPIPVVFNPEGQAHAVPEEHLPWTLPDDVDFTPTGEAPLAKSEELKKRTEDIFGKGWIPEVETMDTFIDSSWYFLRYLDHKNEKELVSKEAQKDWMPIDQYFGGSEHTTLHLLYSRFFQKVLFDLGVVKDKEPYKRRLNRGLIMGPDGQKMSKSKGNVINPDEVVENVGTDVVRAYLAFIGPFNEPGHYPWDPNGVVGIRRFLERVVSLKDKIQDETSKETEKLLHKTIQKVGADYEQFKFNTAISALMIFVNAIDKEGITLEQYKTLLQLLAPITPHITEELWEAVGEKESIHLTDWPPYDEALIVDEKATLAIQINGKVRGDIEVKTDASEEIIKEKITQSEELKKWLEDGYEIKKIVPNRLVSIVVK